MYDSRSGAKKGDTMKNDKFSCSKQNNNKQNPDLGEHNEILGDTGNITEIPVTGKNVISFPLKEPSKANCSVKVLCNKSQEENMVFSSSINSSANDQNNESNLLTTKYLALIERKDSIKKLLNWLEKHKIPSIIKDISRIKSMLNDFKSDYKKIVKRTEKVKSYKEDLNDRFRRKDLYSDSSSGYSLTNGVKLKSNKDEKHKFYGNYKILKDKSKIDSNNLKIVFSKYDENNENVTWNTNSKNHQPAQVLKLNYRDRKMETKLCLQNGPGAKNQFMFSSSECKITGQTIFKEKANIGSKLTSCTTQGEIEMLPSLGTIEYKNIENSRPKKTELDKLHEYMCEMFDGDALHVPSVKRRTNKQVNFAKTNIVPINRNNVTSVDQDLEKPKSNKKVSKQSTFHETNKNNNLVCVSMVKDASNKTTSIDYTNLVGCLPPALSALSDQQLCSQIVLKTKDTFDRIPITHLNAESNMNIVGSNADCILFDQPKQEIQKVKADSSKNQATSSK